MAKALLGAVGSVASTVVTEGEAVATVDARHQLTERVLMLLGEAFTDLPAIDLAGGVPALALRDIAEHISAGLVEGAE